jgi:hypothetical protein
MQTGLPCHLHNETEVSFIKNSVYLRVHARRFCEGVRLAAKLDASACALWKNSCNSIDADSRAIPESTRANDDVSGLERFPFSVIFQLLGFWFQLSAASSAP